MRTNEVTATTVMVLCFIAFSPAKAQTTSRDNRTPSSSSVLPGSSIQQLFDQDTRSLRTLGPIPLEEAVDEKEYVVGPNDIFAFMIPGIVPAPVQLIVSPEGVLAIPNVGAIDVRGRTLADVKEEVRKSFRALNPTLTLLYPRQFMISILGAVKYPGPYIGSSVLRVDKMLVMANLDPTTVPVDQRKPTPDNSRRRIIVRRKGQPDRLVDLEKFFAFQRPSDNPFLKEGDILVVPQKNFDQGSVSIYGAVNAPNQFEFREGDSLSMLIAFAQGLFPNADVSNIELSRLSRDATSMETQTVDLGAILRGERTDIALNINDRVVIHEVVDRRRDFKVHVRGEVRFPGLYPITPDSTHLSEVIARAGGFTEFANLTFAEIERKQVTMQGNNIDMGLETQLNMRMSDQLVTPEERGYYELEARLRRGTVAADFVQVFERQDRTKDVLLQDGDIVFVPSTMKNVYVYGQVGRPGFVSFKPGADYRYYVLQAGGLGEESDDGGTRIIKAKTREWKNPSDTMIEAGDYIWVPKDIRYPTSYYLNLVSQAASFVSVVLSMTVIILQLTRN